MSVPSARHRAAARGACACAALAALAVPLRAQTSLEETIRQYSATSIEGYVQPLADVLVANLSSGWHNGAPLARQRFSLSVELVGSLAALDENMRTYVAEAPLGFEPATFRTPTVFGGKATAVQHQSIPGLSYRGSDGILDGDYFPGAVPQLRIGGLFGTEVMVRYITTSIAAAIPESEIPDLTIYGVGVRHLVSTYLPFLPFDLAVAASVNAISLGDMADLRGTSFALQAGRTFGVLGLYGGVATDQGRMHLSYTSTNPQAEGTVDVDLTARRSVRVTGGAALRAGPLTIFGDANRGRLTTYSFGLRVGG